MHEPLVKMSRKPSDSRLFVCERLAVPTKKPLKLLELASLIAAQSGSATKSKG
jgi:hypothetical protein